MKKKEKSVDYIKVNQNDTPKPPEKETLNKLQDNACVLMQFFESSKKEFTDSITTFQKGIKELKDSIKPSANTDTYSLYEHIKLMADTVSKKDQVIIKRLEKIIAEATNHIASQFQNIDKINNELLNLKPKKATARELAESKGAILSLDGNVWSFSSKELQNALNNFSLYKLANDTDEYIFENTGKLNDISITNNDILEVEEIRGALLMAILKAVFITMNQKCNNNSNNTVVLHLTSLFNEANIDPRQKYSKDRLQNNKKSMSELRFEYLMKAIKPFDRIVGRLPNGNMYRALSFIKYDKESETITLATPYIFKVLEIAIENKAKKGVLCINHLLHTNIMNEKNYAAVELANAIIVGLLQRGTSNPTLIKKEKKFLENGITKTITIEEQVIKYRTRYSTLIYDKCPQLAKQLDAIDKDNKPNSRQRKNAKLKSVFSTAYRIINEKSDAPKHFVKLEYNQVPPTQSTLDKFLIMTYTDEK